MTKALDVVKSIVSESERQYKQMRDAVMVHGHFYWMGRKVLLIYEDTGKPTNEDKA